MMRDPTVGRFLGALAAVLTVRRDLLVFILTFYPFALQPATRMGTRRFMASRSAMLRLAFSFFPYAASRNRGRLSAWN